MEPRSLEDLADACAGRLLHGNPRTLIRRVSTDSRLAGPGDLFVALAGPRFDGHDFVEQAARQGAAAVLVSGAKFIAPNIPCAVLSVADPRRALGEMAAVYRREFQPQMFAVAGSNGKTSTKDLLASVLRRRWQTLASEASFNNDVGVPLTLFKLEQSHQAAVLEAGTNHPGELAPLLRMIRPRFGVLTGIGREHLEFFGNLEGVAQEEGCLAEALPGEGKLFLNGDSECLAVVKARCWAPVVQVGFSEPNDWQALDAALDDNGTRFQVRSPRGEFDGEYRIQIWGRHHVRNALLALAAGAELGLTPEEARSGLAACPPSKMRMESWEIGGVRILDDAYNANLDSMRAALETLRDIPGFGKRMAVLGDMAELGEESAAAHEEIGRLALRYGVDTLVTVGSWAPWTAQAARESGLEDCHTFETVPEAAAYVKEMMKPGDLVLLKASRTSGFERIGAVLRGESD
jgi:UDP-N-acetylmuramoyl-tripeptide--D-alanyl-D-alanine ligase